MSLLRETPADESASLAAVPGPPNSPLKKLRTLLITPPPG